MRCLTLAALLKEEGASSLFVCRSEPGALLSLIRERGFQVAPIPAENVLSPGTDARETRSKIAKSADPADWIVVDHYALDQEWETAIKGAGERILVIDDLANRAHSCDALLDQNLFNDAATRYAARVPANCARMLGPRYALLQPEYQELRPKAKPRSGQIRRLLVFFGASDINGLTVATLAALRRLQRDIAVDVVLPSDSEQAARIRSVAAELGNCAVHENLRTLAPLILAADLAIGAAGTTTWERLCLGLPSLVVTIAANQSENASQLSARGLAVWLGDAAEVNEESIAGALAEQLYKGIDQEWSKRCFAEVDGRGAERVAAVMTTNDESPLHVRQARPDDEETLLRWANDPHTRANSFSTEAITPEAHAKWLAARLAAKEGGRLYVVDTHRDVSIGQVRFDRRGEEWTIDYSLDPVFRGRKLGARLLNLAIDEFSRTHSGETLIGEVRIGNQASCRVFESLGFTGLSDGDRRIFRRPA